MTTEEIIADLEDRGFKVETRADPRVIKISESLIEPIEYRVTINRPICDYMTANELMDWYHSVITLKDYKHSLIALSSAKEIIP